MLTSEGAKCKSEQQIVHNITTKLTFAQLSRNDIELLNSSCNIQTYKHEN